MPPYSNHPLGHSILLDRALTDGKIVENVAPEDHPVDKSMKVAPCLPTMVRGPERTLGGTLPNSDVFMAEPVLEDAEHGERGFKSSAKSQFRSGSGPLSGSFEGAVASVGTFAGIEHEDSASNSSSNMFFIQPTTSQELSGPSHRSIPSSNVMAAKHILQSLKHGTRTPAETAALLGNTKDFVERLLAQHGAALDTLPPKRSRQNGCGFLNRLCYDVRILIYKLLLTYPGQFQIRPNRKEIRQPFLRMKECSGTRNRHPDPTFSPAILRTCKAIHQEAIPIIYGANTFSLYSRPGSSTWLRTIGGSNIAELKSLIVRADINRGTHSGYGIHDTDTGARHHSADGVSRYFQKPITISGVKISPFSHRSAKT